MTKVEEFNEIAHWLSANAVRRIEPPCGSLPSPAFESGGRTYISFSSNNYLGLAQHPRLIEAAQQSLARYGVGNCESRLLGGDLDVYRKLEARLAALKHKPDAIMFATGYMTNLGVLSTLVNTSQIARLYGFRATKRYKYVYFSDEFNHMSIREGIRISGAERHNYRHRDMNHLETLLKANHDALPIIVTDGVFSQEGTIAPLPELLALAERYDAMVYVDDAHATGVLGEHGGGTSEYFHCYDPRIIQMGTLSKAFGSIGGFVAVEQTVADILRLACPVYAFTSPIPPDQASALLAAIDLLEEEPQYRQRLWENQRYFVKQMAPLGYALMSTDVPIIPVLIGDEGRCNRFASVLKDEGIHVDCIQFPAVPLGKSRLRFMMNANHTHAQLDHVVAVMAQLAKSAHEPIQG